jgi:hypothetical protein
VITAGSWETTTAEQWRLVLDVNLLGAWNTCAAYCRTLSVTGEAWLTSAPWRGSSVPAGGQISAVTDPSATWSRRRVVSVLTLGLIVLFVYTGLEVSAGQRETSYLRGHLGLSASGAGLAAFGYWGALTAVRIGLALQARPVSPRRVIGWGHGRQRRCRRAHLVATQHRGRRGRVCHPRRRPRRGVPGHHRQHAAADRRRASTARIAWQVGAAAAGGSGISALIGLLIGTTGLAILGPAIFTLALLLVLANSTLARLAPISSPTPFGGA